MDDNLRNALLREYGEVSSNFRLLTDIRFKLLALLPIAAAATAALGFKGGYPGFELFALSLFGLFVTLGLATYNERNNQLYNELVGRAALIERKLGLADGGYANRPRAWLKLKLGRIQWAIDHGTGIATIYSASIMLWLFGILAPALTFGKRFWPGTTTAGITWPINAVALACAIVITLVGLYLIRKQIDRQQNHLRLAAADSVSLACGQPLEQLRRNDPFVAACATLAGKKEAVVRARLDAYSKLDPNSLSLYVPAGSSALMAAQVVALITDMPPRWLLDCATDRRGEVTRKQP